MFEESIILQTQRLVQTNSLLEALNLLSDHSSKKWLITHINILKSQLDELQTKENRSTLSREELRLQKNQLREGILNLANIKKKPKKSNRRSDSKKSVIKKKKINIDTINTDIVNF